MNTSKSLNLRGQLNTIIYEVTDSDDVVKQLADLLVPFIIKREAAIVEAVEGIYGDSDGLREFAGLNLIKPVPDVPSKRRGQNE